MSLMSDVHERRTQSSQVWIVFCDSKWHVSSDGEVNKLADISPSVLLIDRFAVLPQLMMMVRREQLVLDREEKAVLRVQVE